MRTILYMKGILITSIEKDATDIMTSKGDFIIKDTQEQEVALTCKYIKGQLKSDLSVGAGIDYMKNGIWSLETKNYLLKEIKKDNSDVKDISFKNNKLKIKL